MHTGVQKNWKNAVWKLTSVCKFPLFCTQEAKNVTKKHKNVSLMAQKFQELNKLFFQFVALGKCLQANIEMLIFFLI